LTELLLFAEVELEVPKLLLDSRDERGSGEGDFALSLSKSVSFFVVKAGKELATLSVISSPDSIVELCSALEVKDSAAKGAVGLSAALSGSSRAGAILQCLRSASQQSRK
jgi:hypothetical protein